MVLAVDKLDVAGTERDWSARQDRDRAVDCIHEAPAPIGKNLAAALMICRYVQESFSKPDSGITRQLCVDSPGASIAQSKLCTSRVDNSVSRTLRKQTHRRSKRNGRRSN